MIVEARGFVLRRNWIPVVGSLVLLVAGVVAAHGAGPFELRGPLGFMVAWFGLFLAPLFYVRKAFPRAKPCAFRATESGLTIEGSPEVRSEDIVEVKLTPRRDADAVVELTLRGPRAKTLTLRTGAHEAKALLDLFGARRASFRLIVPYGKRFLGTFLVLMAFVVLTTLFGSGAATVLFALPSCIFYAALLAWPIGYLRGRLVIGADGFTTRWLTRERFTAFRDVSAVRAKQRFGDPAVADTLVELMSGRFKVRLRTVEAPNTNLDRGNESRAMLAHMHEAFTRSARLVDGSVDVPALVQRGARSESEWLSGIDALVRGGGSRYRVAAVSSDMLSEVATDPSAAVESRVGAAAALIRMGDESLRTRVRVAAEGCAESELRDTLLALSEARDDETTERALGLLRRR